MNKSRLPYFAILFLLLPGCMNHMFYKPNRIVYDTPEEHGLAFEDVFFPSADSTRLHGWFVPASSGTRFGVVIYFHGNFANITYNFKQVRRLPGEGFDLFAFDYRGYGKSEGTPSRRGVQEDSIAAINYVLSRPGFKDDNVFVFAQSLGGAIAISAVAETGFPEIRAMAVESAFCSYREETLDQLMAKTRETVGDIPCLSFQLWPIVRLVAKDEFSPERSVAKISPIPLLLIYGTQDTLVSYRHGQELFNRANDPKWLWTVDGGRHLDVFHASDENTRRLAEYFKTHGKY